MLGSDISDLVITKLDEKSAFLTRSSSILLSGDGIDDVKPVYSYIDDTLPIAANETLRTYPLYRLTPYDAVRGANEYDSSMVDYNDKVLTVTLPSDFLRLYSVRASDWDRPVNKAITQLDPMYMLQRNKYTRGTPQKPVVVYLGDRYDDNVKIECYTSASESIPELLYIQQFDSGIEYSDNIAEMVALNCARKIAEIYNDSALVKIFADEMALLLTNVQ